MAENPFDFDDSLPTPSRRYQRREPREVAGRNHFSLGCLLGCFFSAAAMMGICLLGVILPDRNDYRYRVATVSEVRSQLRSAGVTDRELDLVHIGTCSSVGAAEALAAEDPTYSTSWGSFIFIGRATIISHIRAATKTLDGRR